MSDPKPLSELIALMERVFQKAAELDQTPEGQAHRATYFAGETRRRQQQLITAAEERGIPCEASIRNVLLQEQPFPTQAMTAVQRALQWRLDQPTAAGSRQPVCIVLGGPPGNGKTTALSWAVARHDRPATYVTSAVIASTLRNGWSENEERWRRWGSVDLLAVDELGLEDGSEGAARVGALIAQRNDHGRATFCAGNLDAPTFIARYGNTRLNSRLRYGQSRNGDANGLPWWTDLSDCDLRNPANRSAFMEQP